MAKSIALRDPWLVAVWPGMGNVALLAGGYLLRQLGARPVGEIDSADFFEVEHVDVQAGLATVGGLPRNLLFEWRDPARRRDLIVFVGEAQPAAHGYRLCQRVADYAARRGARRVFTFAAMATQLHPGDPPRVFAAATDAAARAAANLVDVEVLAGGQISGLNGIMLAAGAERGMSGVCLLGELPFYAVGVPNPRAAHAALMRFVELSGIELDLTELDEQAQAAEQDILELLEKMQAASADERAADADDEEEDDDDRNGNAATAAGTAPEPAPRLDAKQERRIETLFDRARHDRGKAVDLKRELDRLGVFKAYEDRFLDLFRQGQ